MVQSNMLNIKTVLLVVVVSLVFTGCVGKKKTNDNNQTSGSETVAELLQLTPTTADQTLDTHYSQAMNAAHVWQADAAIHYVEIRLPADLKNNQGEEVYVFGSSADRNNWWTYSIDQTTNKFVRALIPKEDFLGFDITQINTTYWQGNYVEALQKADKAGGKEFRDKNNGAKVNVILMQRAPRGWLWWTIEYVASDGTKFIRLVNPFRGEVVDEQGNELSGSATGETSTDSTTNTSNSSDNSSDSSSTPDSLIGF